MATTQYPNYYPEFKCIAGDCTETCCAGWEVDLDEEALFYYENIAPAPFGDVIRSRIAETKDGGYCFPLTENGRCPFLNDDNLCDIIINLGETRICRTCTEHPRFVVEIDDYKQYDLSLSCPEAARLFFRDDMDFEVLTENYEPEFVLSDASYLDNEDFMRCMTCRDKALELLSDRKKDLPERVADVVRFVSGFSSVSCTCLEESDSQILSLLTNVDYLDDRWEKDIELLKKHIVYANGKTLSNFLDENIEFLSKNFEKLSKYLTFRYFPDAYYDGSPVYGLNMVVRSLHFLFLMSFARWREKGGLTLAEFKDICHSYSKEIEHDENNIAAFKGLLQEEID